MGRRVDLQQRPELSLGSYEFVATLDYCKVTRLGGHPHILGQGARTERGGGVALLARSGCYEVL